MFFGFTVFVAVVIGSFQTIRSEECFDEFECANETISLTEIGSSYGIECYGFGSCYKSEIISILDENNNTVFGGIKCYGSRSCQNSIIFDDVARYVSALGYLSLAFAESVIVTFQSSITCSGEASCYGIKYLNSSGLYCKGARSCNNIEFAEIDALEANGAFALMNGNFYSNFQANPFTTSDDIIIWLYGFYSGYNASFYCREGDSCRVTCAGNGCKNFNYYCDNNAVKCDILCVSQACTDLPNGWEEDPDSDTISYIYTGNNVIVPESLDFSFLSSPNNLINKLYNKEYLSNVYYEQEYECPNYEDVENITDCDFNSYETRCTYQTLESIDDSVCINSYRELYESSISIIGNNNNLYCNGGSSIYFGDINLNNNNNVYCRGGVSCDNINNPGNIIEITGSGGLGGGSIIDAIEVACFGDQCGETSNIFKGVAKLYTFGYRAFWGQSQIISNGIDIDIYLLGQEATFGLDELICNGTDTCTIYGVDDSAFTSINLNNKVNCDSDNQCTIEYVIINDPNVIETDENDVGGGTNTIGGESSENSSNENSSDEENGSIGNVVVNRENVYIWFVVWMFLKIFNA